MNKYTKIVISVISVLSYSTNLLADDSLNFKFNTIKDAAKANIQGKYDKLTTPISDAVKYQFLNDSASTGLLGIDIGVGASQLSIPSEAVAIAKSYLNNANSFPDFILIPRLILQKGLPFGIDLSLNLAAIPQSDIKLLGLGVQYSFNLLDVIPLLPVGLYLSGRVAYSSFTGLKQLSINVTNYEALVTVNTNLLILSLSAWAGAGISTGSAVSKFNVELNGLGAQEIEFENKNVGTSYMLVGGKIGITLLKFVVEAQLPTKENFSNIYSGKVSLGFSF